MTFKEASLHLQQLEIGAIESQISINYNKNISLPEQYAMECIYNFWKVGGDACNGGQPIYVRQ